MYKNSKAPIVRIGGFIIMGFLTIVIIISFGMPDFMSRMNVDQNTAAKVNDDTITRLELARTMKNYSDRRGGGEIDDAIKGQVLNSLIQRKLMVQYAAKMGITVTDDQVASMIRRIFRDETGQFNEFYFKRTLEMRMTSMKTFYEEMRDELAVAELNNLYFSYGMGVSPEEVAFKNAVANASFSAKYAFISNEDLKKRLGASIAVSDAEIDEEMTKNKSEIKDPATDRERFKVRVADRKLDEAKKALVRSVDEVALKGEGFDKAAALLGGKVSSTAAFKPGEPVKESGANGKVLYALSESDIFVSDFTSLAPGVCSRAVSGHDGIYVFTPASRAISFVAPKEAEAAVIAKDIKNEKDYSIESSVYRGFYEKSKIVRNLKDEPAENN